MSAGAELQALRRRVLRRCEGCGETVPMLAYQAACSGRCRQRIRRSKKTS